MESAARDFYPEKSVFLSSSSSGVRKRLFHHPIFSNITETRKCVQPMGKDRRRQLRNTTGIVSWLLPWISIIMSWAQQQRHRGARALRSNGETSGNPADGLYWEGNDMKRTRQRKPTSSYVHFYITCVQHALYHINQYINPNRVSLPRVCIPTAVKANVPWLVEYLQARAEIG